MYCTVALNDKMVGDWFITETKQGRGAIARKLGKSRAEVGARSGVTRAYIDRTVINLSFHVLRSWVFFYLRTKWSKQKGGSQ
jgi:hypothetical protein